MKDIVLDKMKKKLGFHIAVYTCRNRKNKMGKKAKGKYL